MTCDLEKQISKFHSKKNWKKVLELLYVYYESNVRRKFLWTLLNVDDLSWLRNIILEKKLKGIVSIGCGCGLLEWIIQEQFANDFEVIGVEVDRNWWHSKYSPKLFIGNMIFADETEGKIPPYQNHAIMFCYFNNELAFLNYMYDYKGEVVIVIGPDKATNRHTNPLPFDHKFGDLGWRLDNVHILQDSKDLISVFVRLKQNQYFLKEQLTNY